MALSIGSDFSNNYGYSINNEERLMLSMLSYNKIADNSDQSYGKVRNYAQEGELMYEKRLDLDEDGTITFDEVKVYCQKNKVSLNDVLNNWQKYRMLENEKDVTDEVMNGIGNEEDETDDTELVYAQKGDEKYDTEMDADKDNVVTYNEYWEYRIKNNTDSKTQNNLEDIIKEYGLDVNEANNSLKSKGNIEVEA